jgi:predicted nicotinamide N-methyase
MATIARLFSPKVCVSAMPKLERLPEPYIQQAYGVYLLQSQHRLVRSLKRLYEPSVHGHKAWHSSFILMDYLLHRPFRRGSRVMEIGCGWGPAAVFCAKKMNARVTGVDIDKDVFPFLDTLAQINDVKVRSLQSRFEDLTTSRLAQERVIIGSDICFWDSMVKPLFNLIQRAMKGGVERVIIADPGRPTFYELGELCRERFVVELQEWYAVEPNHVTGEVLEIRAK